MTMTTTAPENPEVPEVIVTADLLAEILKMIDAAFALKRLSLQMLGAETFIERIGRPAALVVIPGDPVNAEFIRRLPDSVRLIASYSTGLDHVDVAAAEARGIVVSNTPDVLTDATADIAMLLMLGCVRGARPAGDAIRNDAWAGWGPARVFGHDLNGRVLGVMGAGRIGAATAKRAAAFGMALVYWSRRANPALDVMGARRIDDIAAFMAASDVVSLHLPSTDETRGIVNARTLAHLRDGSYLVNTARGDLINDEAVIEALKTGRLAGVGLDVFAGEPNIHPGYRNEPKAFLLPHIGSATVETRHAMGLMVVESLKRTLLPAE